LVVGLAQVELGRLPCTHVTAEVARAQDRRSTRRCRRGSPARRVRKLRGVLRRRLQRRSGIRGEPRHLHRESERSARCLPPAVCGRGAVERLEVALAPGVRDRLPPDSRQHGTADPQSL